MEVLKTLKGFIAKFWEDETSQVTKVTVLSMASILGVLSIMLIPQNVSAGYPCTECYRENCDMNTCHRVNYCEQGCEHWHMDCTGGSTYDLIYCPIPEPDLIFCGSQC